MVDKITLVKGDTGPPMVVTLTNEETGTAINVSGATVTLEFYELGEEEPRSVLSGVLTDPANGKVTFYFTEDVNALDGEEGPYEGEIKIVFADGTIQTVYDKLKFWVRG